MALLIQRIAAAVNRTFIARHASVEQMEAQISNLCHLMDGLTPPDVGFDESLVTRPQSNDAKFYDEAPVSYIGIWEDDPLVTISIFVLRTGSRIPLHDHPGMHGLIKVFYGSVKVNTYNRVMSTSSMTSLSTPPSASAPLPSQSSPSISASLTTLGTSDNIIMARKKQEIVDSTSSTSYLTPTSYNYHELIADHGPAAFIDILSPSYGSETNHRPCTYYREVSLGFNEARADHVESLVGLARVKPPSDFWTSRAEYLGPSINPRSSSGV